MPWPNFLSGRKDDKIKDSLTLLYDAIKSGDERAVDRIYTKDIQSEISSFQTFFLHPYPQTPLGYAVQLRQKRIIHLLLEKGAPLNEKFLGEGGYTPLDVAILDQTDVDPEIVQIFLDRGCDVSARICGCEYTLLHKLSQQGRIETIKFLLGKGASLDALAWGETPFYSAIACNQSEVVKFYLSIKPELLEEQLGKKMTPLYYAVATKNTETVEVLLQSGAEVKTQLSDSGNKDRYGESPLHQAVYLGLEKTVQLLLDYNSEPNMRTLKRKTPLHYSTSLSIENRNDITTMLIKAGADVKVIDAEGKTPLHNELCSSPDKDVVRMLLSRGADPKIEDFNGDTPLSLAKQYDDSELMDILSKAPVRVKGVPTLGLQTQASGIDPDHQQMELVQDYMDFVNPGGDKADETYHGSTGIDLVAAISPEADLYVARVFKGMNAEAKTPARIAQMCGK
ncbi:Ankyrin-1 [Dactylellina cionopaga]|nr:Ankyrin-1 [Dactylellina cionopaga]